MTELFQFHSLSLLLLWKTCAPNVKSVFVPCLRSSQFCQTANMANIRGVFHWVLPALWVTTSFAHLSRHSIVFIQRMTKLATRWRATCNRNASNLNQTSLKSQDHQDISRPSRPRKRRETSGNVTTLGTTLCRPQFPKSSPQAVKLAVMLARYLVLALPAHRNRKHRNHLKLHTSGETQSYS